MPLQGVLHNLRKRCTISGSVVAGRDRMLGRRPPSRAVLVVLAVRRYLHETRVALAPGGITP